MIGHLQGQHGTNGRQSEAMDVGVDWITASANDRIGYQLFSNFAERQIDSERRAGNEVRPAHLEGFAGYQCGAIGAFARDGLCILRLSSHIAREHWPEVVESSTNVSRLDLQLTYRYTPHDPNIAGQVERKARAHARTTGSKRDVTLMRSRRRGSTCYLGTRVSDRFARVYDKGFESGLEEYAGCWRFEVELKRGYAKETAGVLLTQADRNAFIASQVAAYFRSAGIRLHVPTLERLCISSRKPVRPRLSRILSWLTSSVRPSVVKLVEAGMLPELIEALGLADHVEVKPNEKG